MEVSFEIIIDNIANLVFVELFQTLFNILYDENINCRIVKSALVEDKLLNWNRLNAQICFNYLQQEFYLVKPTMRTLAGGKSQKAILKLLRILINTSQSNFGDLALDDECIRDVADVITADTPDGIVGAAGINDDNRTQIEVRPRGAVLTSTNADNFYNDPMDNMPKQAQAAQQQEEQEYDEEYGQEESKQEDEEDQRQFQ